MKTVAAFLVFVCLTIFAVKGHPGNGKERCLCQGPGVKMVRPKLIDKLVIHPVSAYCQRLEIVVKLKNGAGSKCLNPDSPFTKNIIERITNRTRSGSM